MSVKQIDIGVIRRAAPNRGPTNSSDYNATNEEILNSLVQLSSSWNQEIQPLLDTLPGGLTGVDRDKRTDTPNPFVNGFDGSQFYTDLTSTSVTDDGRFYEDKEQRPLTIKETFNKIQSQLNNSIQDLEVKIAKVDKDSGLSPRQKQSIGSRIFDPGTDSSPTSLDGIARLNQRNIDQLGLDISGDGDYLQGNGAQTLLHSIKAQLEAIQASHDYDENFNTMTHRHLQFHEHRYHIKPIGDINGTNVKYYLPAGEEFVPKSLRIIVNGNELPRDAVFYSEDNDRKGFTLNRTPLEADGSESDDRIWIHYDVDTTGEK